MNGKSIICACVLLIAGSVHAMEIYMVDSMKIVGGSQRLIVEAEIEVAAQTMPTFDEWFLALSNRKTVSGLKINATFKLLDAPERFVFASLRDKNTIHFRMMYPVRVDKEKDCRMLFGDKSSISFAIEPNDQAIGFLKAVYDVLDTSILTELTKLSGSKVANALGRLLRANLDVSAA